MSTWILISLMSSWLGTQSIQGIFSRMPKGQLVMIEYSEQGTMAGYRYYGCVELQKDGSVTVKAQKESYGEIIEKKGIKRRGMTGIPVKGEVSVKCLRPIKYRIRFSNV